MSSGSRSEWSGGGAKPHVSDALEQLFVRLEFAWTIVLDMFVVMVALWARRNIVVFAAWLSPTISPAEPHSWATAALETVGDVGIVSAAGLFTLFDILKRVILGWRSLRATWTHRPEAPTGRAAPPA